MMDQKYLDEIKARCVAGRPAARIDVKALIAEVERLTIENLRLKDATIQCDGYEKRYHAALAELDAKDQQIATLKSAKDEINRYNIDCTKQCDKLLIENATLKKALELACDEKTRFGGCCEAEDTYQAKKLYGRYIRMAQEQEKKK